MPRKKMFRPGTTLTARQLVDELLDGGYVFWNHKLMHKSFLSGMPFRVVMNAANQGIIKSAQRNEDTV